MMDGKEETIGEIKTRLEKGFRHGFIGVDRKKLELDIELVKFWLKDQGLEGMLSEFSREAELCLLH